MLWVNNATKNIFDTRTDHSCFIFFAFAKIAFYEKVNQELVNLSDVNTSHKVVDLACGAGAVTKSIIEKLKGACDGIVFGVDLSSVALNQAREELQSATDYMVRFIQGGAENLWEPVKEKVDAVLFCNATHLVSDKIALANEVRKTLKHGGIFAFNTSFYKGSHPPESG